MDTAESRGLKFDLEIAIVVATDGDLEEYFNDHGFTQIKNHDGIRQVRQQIHESVLTKQEARVIDFDGNPPIKYSKQRRNLQ